MGIIDGIKAEMIARELSSVSDKDLILMLDHLIPYLSDARIAVVLQRLQAELSGREAEKHRTVWDKLLR